MGLNLSSNFQKCIYSVDRMPLQMLAFCDHIFPISLYKQLVSRMEKKQAERPGDFLKPQEYTTPVGADRGAQM